MTVRVLCVDDHSIVADGLRARLAVEPDMDLVGHQPDVRDLVEHVRAAQADVVILDIELPGDAFQAIEQLHEGCPEVKTILLSAFVRDKYIESAYRAGAWGYLSKGDSSEFVVDGVRKVMRGEFAFCEEVSRRLQPTGTRRSSRRGLLTSREEQVLRLIAQGKSRTEIADELCRSPMTIDNHRKSIMKKLGLHDRAKLVRYAIAEGIANV